MRNDRLADLHARLEDVTARSVQTEARYRALTERLAAPPAEPVLAFDPGTHTGVSYLYADGGVRLVATLNSPEYADLYQQINDQLTTFMADCLRAGSAGVVVIERFTTVHPGVAASKDGILTQKLCGFIEGLCVLYRLRVVWHTSSVRKAYEDTARSLLNARTISFTPHELSATAHALAYLTHSGG